MAVDYSLIGKRLKEKRKSTGATQEMIAEYLGVSVGYISQLERGKKKINLDTLSKYAAFLRCDITDIISNVSPEQKQYLDQEMATMYNQLEAKQKRMVIEVIKTVLENS